MMLVFVALSCKNNVKDSAAASKEVKSPAVVQPKSEEKVILCFGNSLTAGYGLEQEQAYPAKLGLKLNNLGYNYRVINSGVSGETTAGGLGRLDWVLREKIEVFILELGANDGLRGVSTVETKKNLSAIILRVKAKYPAVKVVLAGMKVPPNMGDDYEDSFESVFPSVAKETAANLIPFFLEDVAGIPSLNQPDGIHPTKDGVVIVVNNVLNVLLPLLERD